MTTANASSHENNSKQTGLIVRQPFNDSCEYRKHVLVLCFAYEGMIDQAASIVTCMLQQCLITKVAYNGLG